MPEEWPGILLPKSHWGHPDCAGSGWRWGHPAGQKRPLKHRSRSDHAREVMIILKVKMKMKMMMKKKMKMKMKMKMKKMMMMVLIMILTLILILVIAIIDRHRNTRTCQLLCLFIFTCEYMSQCAMSCVVCWNVKLLEGPTTSHAHLMSVPALHKSLPRF